jgi:acetolactate synthase-1/2/3 large subunit
VPTFERLTGGQALARSLVAQGVSTIFALPGVQLDWAFDALYDVRERLRVIHVRHEQATAYMADGYARSTGQPGVCMMVPGPGLLNASAALATAYACSSPVVCLTGQVDSHAIDAGYGLLHEVDHQDRILDSLTRWSGRALSPAEIPGLVERAFAETRTGRPRPVALELPPDVLQLTQDIQPAQRAVPAREPGDPDLLRRAADLLRRSERPVIYSGGGTLAAAAWPQLRDLAEHLEAPVVMSVDGRGALSDRDDLAHTGVTGQALTQEADVVLAVGTRFWQPTRVWGLSAAARVIRIDADAAELSRHGQPEVAIHADAGLALTALRDLLDGLPKRVSRRDELRARKRAAEELLSTFQPQADFAAAIRRALPDDGFTVNDLTQVTFYATVGLPIYEPRTFIGPGYQGTLGSALATALGVAAGNPHRAVVALAGDGGFLYALGELATQRQHGLNNLISIVFNDSAFGNVKRTQEQSFGGRMLGSDLVNPDFVALGKAFGIDAERVKTGSQLEAALRSALAARRPALIEITTGPMSNAWPVIGPAGGIYPILLEPLK